jgi:hypothetical protein
VAQKTFSKKEKEEMLDRLHDYTALPTPNYEKEFKKFTKFDNIKFQYKRIRNVPTTKLPGKVAKKSLRSIKQKLGKN